ncbi:MAG TPA: preprotein translocase subunit SecG [Sphingobium sp.]|nr:preprotein translocase subunit SecG [Sphingobium sp.]
MFTFLLVVQAIIAFVLVTVILMQRSEGGGLGMGGGGGPSGLMSARGAADFLTRMTGILAAVFVGMSIILAIIAATQHRGATVDTSLVGKTTTSAPLAGGEDALPAGTADEDAAPAAQNQAVPLAN